ncbi:TPA: hypothetical protein NJY08_004773 [Salmonella enterica subsp. enterica serovar Typhi str. AG3]|nr:hypothetical protein [Salmonella enterica subsp. enterica serovar Typhi str. AG3]
MTLLYKEENTTVDLKVNRGYIAAKTLIKQAEIFNCSLETSWDEHIHRGIHQAHNKEDIIELGRAILKQENVVKPVNNKVDTIVKGYQCELTEHKVVLKYVWEREDLYRLEVYKGKKRIYRHASLAHYPFNKTNLILRNKLGIARVELKWIKF